MAKSMYLNLTSTDEKIFSHDSSIPVEVDDYESQKENGVIRFSVKSDYSVYFKNDRGKYYKMSLKKGNTYTYDADNISEKPEYDLEDTDAFKQLRKEIREHDSAWAAKQMAEVKEYMADKWSFAEDNNNYANHSVYGSTLEPGGTGLAYLPGVLFKAAIVAVVLHILFG